MSDTYRTSVDRYSMTVSAARTVDAAMLPYDTDSDDCESMTRMLRTNLRGALIYPGLAETAAGVLLNISGRHADCIIYAFDHCWNIPFELLSEIGYLDNPGEAILNDRTRDTYLDFERRIEMIYVTDPFTVVVPDYRRRGTSAIRDVLPVDAGSYVIGWIGTSLYGRLNVHSVGYRWNRLSMDTELARISATDGAMAPTVIRARCQRYGSHSWVARDGSYAFEPDNSTVSAWHYDSHAEDHDTDDTVACVVPGCGGRLGFTASA